MSRPVVFVSSTVHDLSDMRSALKYWLEQWGYEVRLSEYADFPGVLGKNSYEACLDAVKGADYCIVLIGNRAGGVWDRDNGVTISRKEYQTAYELCLQGRMSILVFVRDEVWTVFADRRPLDVQHTSAVMEKTDAELVFPFIEEARRAAEMRDVLDGKSLRPRDNWIFRFKGFEEIVTAIRMQFRIDKPLRRGAMNTNLLWECLENLRRLAFKHDGNLLFYDQYGSELRDVELGRDDWKREVELPNDVVKSLLLYALFGPGKRGLSTFILDAAIASGEYLDYSRDTGTLIVGEMQTRLLELRDHTEWWQSSNIAADLRQITLKYSGVPVPKCVHGAELSKVVVAWECQWRIRALTVEIANYLLSGDPAHLQLQLEGRSPLIGMRDEVKTEHLTHEEVRSWLMGQCSKVKGGQTE